MRSVVDVVGTSKEAGVDGEWRPDVTSGRRRVQSNGKPCQRPERLRQGTLRTHIIICADVVASLGGIPTARTSIALYWRTREEDANNVGQV